MERDFRHWSGLLRYVKGETFIGLPMRDGLYKGACRVVAVANRADSLTFDFGVGRVRTA